MQRWTLEAGAMAADEHGEWIRYETIEPMLDEARAHVESKLAWLWMDLNEMLESLDDAGAESV